MNQKKFQLSRYLSKCCLNICILRCKKGTSFGLCRSSKAISTRHMKLKLNLQMSSSKLNYSYYCMRTLTNKLTPKCLKYYKMCNNSRYTDNSGKGNYILSRINSQYLRNIQFHIVLNLHKFH